MIMEKRNRPARELSGGQRRLCFGPHFTKTRDHGGMAPLHQSTKLTVSGTISFG